MILNTTVKVIKNGFKNSQKAKIICCYWSLKFVLQNSRWLKLSFLTENNSKLPPPFGYCPTKPKVAYGRPTPTLLLALCALVINRQHLTHQHGVDLSHVQLHQRSPSSTSVCCCVAKIITLCSTSGRVCVRRGDPFFSGVGSLSGKFRSIIVNSTVRRNSRVDSARVCNFLYISH